MRKWMRDRIKRRKKPAAEAPAEKLAVPAPLQPKFYDNESSDPEIPDRPAEVQESEPAPEAEAAEASPAEITPEQPEAAAATSPARRRRRGRGRRGASRSKTPDAATQPVAQEAAAAPEIAAGPADIEIPVPEVAAQPEIQASPAEATRATKGTVVLAIGLPGSGKSSWFKRHNIRPLSSDLLRELLFDNAEEQRFQDLVFSNLRSMLKARLISRRPMNYVDATNLTSHDRHSWIKLAKDYGYDVQGVFFDVPLEVCLERNHRRNRVVDEDVMRRMAGKLKAPTFEEGFSKITVVRVKQKE